MAFSASRRRGLFRPMLQNGQEKERKLMTFASVVAPVEMEKAFRRFAILNPNGAITAGTLRVKAQVWPTWRH